MDEIINQLKEFINTFGSRNIIFVAVAIIVCIIVFLIYRGLRLRVFRKQIVEIENQMNAVKSLPLQYRLGRVHSISKNMPDILELYNEYAEEYEKISDFQKNELSVLINEVDEQLFYGKLRKVNQKIMSLNAMLSKYEKDSQDLLAKIEKITEIENVQRIEIIRVKEKYRQIVDEFEKIRFKIDEFIPRLLELFNEIDDSFVKLESMMNNQRFEDAKTFTQEIEKQIDWINTHLEDIPSYVAFVRQYVPKKIEHIQALLDIMPQEHYSLNQLHVEERFSHIKDMLSSSTERIKNLDLDDIASELEVLVKEIEALSSDLEKEKEAYDKFNESWDNCYLTITDIYDQYKEALIDYNQIKKLYQIEDLDIVIDDHFREFDVILKESYELEEEMKKGDFSYIMMIEKVVSLKENASVHQNYLNDFHAIRDHLYMQEQRAIDELENINIVLLEIKSEIKNKHLPMINESYKDYIQDSYDKAAQIQSYRQNRPVELSELSQKVDAARDVIYKLYDNVHNLIVTAEMVEEAIVFGNRYRSSFLEVNTELTKAEVLFRNGEYTKALSTAVDIIEKIKPGSYEELIKKTSEKPS